MKTDDFNNAVGAVAGTIFLALPFVAWFLGWVE